MIKFLKIADKYGCLSNFSRHSIVGPDGRVWPRAEHFYQALKFNINTSFNIQEEIRSEKNPKLAKDIAYKYQDRVCANWDDIKFDQMYVVCLLKAKQHEDVHTTLLSTNDEEIGEDCQPWNKNNSIWSIGHDGKGQNLLGKVWMKVREYIKNEQL